jgi:cobalt/nickel transport protein
MEEDKEFLQDTVKVVVHVQAQKGWDAEGSQDFKLIPLTRPYGLMAGMVFRARVAAGVPRTGIPVFVERYSPEPPKKLPPDELITFVSKTDSNGVLTCTLPSPGWWSITAQRDAGSRRYQGKDYPIRERATLWVFVNEAAVSK